MSRLATFKQGAMPTTAYDGSPILKRQHAKRHPRDGPFSDRLFDQRRDAIAIRGRRLDNRPIVISSGCLQEGFDMSETESGYGYAWTDWLAREDPDYAVAREPFTSYSAGEGRELSIKYREMVMIGILAFRGRQA